MNFNSIRQKLVVAFAALALVPLLIVGALAYLRSSDNLEARAGEQMFLQAQAAVDAIDRNLFERYGDVQAFAGNPDARGNREQAAAAADFFTTNYGIYDLMLIVDREGRVVAANTVNHEGEPLDTSALIGQSVKGAEWFEQCVNGTIQPAQTYYSDLAEDPLVAKLLGTRGLALNFSAPVYDTNGKVVRVWSNRASWNRIAQDIMRERVATLKSRGVTAVEYQILNKDGVVIDDYDPKAILDFNLVEAGLDAAQRVVHGEDGYTVETHKRRQVDQINGHAASKGALGFDGYGWGVLVRQDAEEASADARGLRNFILLIGLLSAAVIVALAMRLARGIAEPIVETERVLDAVARGDYSARVAVETHDEIGRMGRSLNEMISKVRQAFDEVEKAAAREKGQADEFDRRVDGVLHFVSAAARGDLTAKIEISGQGAIRRVAEALGNWVGSLRSSVQRIATSAEDLNRSSSSLTDVSRQLASNAEETSSQAGVVTHVSEQVSSNVGSVSTSAEQMSESIREISRSTTDATQVAGEAVGTAEAANETIRRLGESSTEVGNVIKVITSIAEQTNLLALNATIEAARAGEAGKGFAVVANEVKELAKQTSQATEDISHKIEAIQSDSIGAVEAINQVTEVIGRINDISTSIASAVEEQTVTTTEISRNVEEASRGTAEIGSNVSGVATAAGNTSQGANETLQAAESLLDVAAGLQEVVGQFKI